jgi:hypothetical protein
MPVDSNLSGQDQGTGTLSRLNEAAFDERDVQP